MADYLRFEFYIPRIYTITEPDPSGGAPRQRRVSLNPETMQAFIEATLQRYRGITQANPHATAPYKGWWRPEDTSHPIAVDYLTYLFGLIKLDQSDEALGFFTGWKTRLESETEQDVILVVYHPVQIIGDML